MRHHGYQLGLMAFFGVKRQIPLLSRAWMKRCFVSGFKGAINRGDLESPVPQGTCCVV